MEEEPQQKKTKTGTGLTKSGLPDLSPIDFDVIRYHILCYVTLGFLVRNNCYHCYNTTEDFKPYTLYKPYIYKTEKEVEKERKVFFECYGRHEKNNDPFLVFSRIKLRFVDNDVDVNHLAYFPHKTKYLEIDEIILSNSSNEFKKKILPIYNVENPKNNVMEELITLNLPRLNINLNILHLDVSHFDNTTSTQVENVKTLIFRQPYTNTSLINFKRLEFLSLFRASMCVVTDFPATLKKLYLSDYSDYYSTQLIGCTNLEELWLDIDIVNDDLLFDTVRSVKILGIHFPKFMYDLHFKNIQNLEKLIICSESPVLITITKETLTLTKTYTITDEKSRQQIIQNPHTGKNIKLEFCDDDSFYEMALRVPK